MNPYALAGGLLLVIAAWFGGSHNGRRLERGEWIAKENKIIAAHVVEMRAEVEKRLREQAFNSAVARKASENYEKTITDLKSDYAADIARTRAAGGLRIPVAQCRPGTPPAAGQTAGAVQPNEAAPATQELPERTQERLYELAARADGLAEQLRNLQDWIRNQGFYGE